MQKIVRYRKQSRLKQPSTHNFEVISQKNGSLHKTDSFVFLY